MTLGRFGPGAVACAGALLIAACGGPGSQALPAVPAIDDPQDARNVDPCTLIPQTQLDQLELQPGVRGSNELGPQCVWGGPGARKVTLTLFSKGQGLAVLARRSDPAAARVRIEGYPAVETFTERGAYCQYDVGIAPNQALVATMTAGQPDSCTALQNVLDGVLRRLPAYRP